MAIKSRIYKFLKKNLNEYVYGLEQSQLDVELLSGRMELANIHLRPDRVNTLLANLGLPIHLKAGLIGRLKFKCNYLDIFGGPLDVEIDNLLLVFGPISHIFKEQWINEDDPVVVSWLNNRENDIVNYGKSKPASCVVLDPAELSCLKKKKKSRRKKRHQSDDDNSDIEPAAMFERLKRNKLTIRDDSFVDDQKPGLVEEHLLKILKNLVLKVKNIHISYEDESYSYQNPFSFGFRIDRIELKNLAQEWTVAEGKIVKVKSSAKVVRELTVQGIAAYIYSMANMVIPLSLYEETIASEIGVFEAFPASEFKELFIQQSNSLSKDHQSTFIEPTSLKVCLSFTDDKAKAVGLVENLGVNLTPSMTECLKNFWDYSKNVKIWALVSKYRPEERIPPRSAKREHRKERRMRREIVRQWFQYAYQFVKVKNAADKFLKERTKERKFVKQIEKDAKIQEKISEKKMENVEVKNESNFVEPASTFSSIFSISKKKPATSGGLKSLIDNLNKKPAQKPGKRPYDGEKHFPEYLVNSDIEVSLNKAKVRIVDSDSGVTLEAIIWDAVQKISAIPDELNLLLNVQEISLNIKNQNKETEFFKSGNVNEKDNQCLKVKFTYRPAEFLIPGDTYASYNMYESQVNIGKFVSVYSHNILNQLFLLKENLLLSKPFRKNANLDYIKALMKKVKKRKIAKVFGTEMKKSASLKKLGLKLVDLQNWVKEKVAESSNHFLNILFSADLNVNSGEVSFNDFSPNTLMVLSVPESKVSIGKTKDQTFLSALGMTFKTPSTPSGLFDFFTGLGNLLCENLKKMEKYTNYKRIN